VTDEKTSDDVAKDEAEAKVDAAAGAEAETKGEVAAEAKPVDSASPEAIARRVAALGEEDQSEVLAREEERKLAERRREQTGKKKKKGGLEVAASKKLSKIGTRAEPKRSIAITADADPLIEKTAKLSEWAKKNQMTVQVVGGLLAVALLGIAGFLYFEHKHETEASTLLTQAVADERGRIGEPPKEDPESLSGADTTPLFKTFDDRREAALKKYREVESRFPKTGAAILARLAEGSLLLDKHDADTATAAFSDVKTSALAAADQEVKGRAIEGLGFSYELKAQLTPAEAPKFLDLAAATYKDLENTVEVRGFKELAMYHQARVALSRGEKDKAKELLVSLKERLNKSEEVTSASSPNAPPSFPFLREVAMARLREIDPTLAPKGAMPPPSGAGAGRAHTPAEIRKMIEDAQKKQGGGAPPGQPPHGGH
jgi:hypothetical protein